MRPRLKPEMSRDALADIRKGLPDAGRPRRNA